MKAWRPLVLVLGALLWHASASAQPDDAVGALLRVTAGADGCVNQAALVPRVRRWLDVPAPSGELAVVVHADAHPLSFSVLRTGEVIAERRFDVLPEDCGDRLDAIAVAIAVAIEHATSGSEVGSTAGGAGGVPPPASEQRGAPDVGPPATARAGSAVAAVPASQPAPAAPSADPGQSEAGAEADAGPAPSTSAARLFAGGMVALEVLPEAAFAITAGGELQRSALRLAAAGVFSFETDTALGGGRARSRLLAARVAACLGTALSELDLEGCGGLAGGVVLAAGDGFPQDRDAAMAWLAAALRGAVRYPQSSWISLRFAVDGLLHALRPQLETTAPAAATSATSVLGAAASLEIVIALP